MIKVRINDTATIPVSDLRDALNEFCDKINAEIDIDEDFHVWADDIDDAEPSDLVDLYNNLSLEDQTTFRKDLAIKVVEDLEFVPENLEDRQKFEAFLEHRGRFSLEQFIQLLNMQNPIEWPGEVMIPCPYCDELLDSDDLGL